MEYQDINGKSVRGEFKRPSNYTEKFTITTRSLSPINSDVLQRLIEERYEVLSCEKQDQIIGVV